MEGSARSTSRSSTTSTRPVKEHSDEQEQATIVCRSWCKPYDGGAGAVEEQHKFANPRQEPTSETSLPPERELSDHGVDSNRCSTLTRSLTYISRRGTPGKTEADFDVADRVEDCGSAGLEQPLPQVQIIGEIVQIPQMMEQRVSTFRYSADDRRISTATAHRSGNSSSVVDRRCATGSDHRQQKLGNLDQRDHVCRTRLVERCGSRDDSLSWNLSRVRAKQSE